MRVAPSACMRIVLAALVLMAAASAAHAGVLVELTDGTKLTVESHWIDGDQVHLVRGGVDMIVPKSRIKSMDEDVADPEVHREGGEVAGTATAAAPEADPGFEKPLGEMTVEELQDLHVDQAGKLLDAQDKRFTALYGGQADQKVKDAAQAEFVKQNKRNAKIWYALEKAKKDAAAAPPAAPTVEQPQ